MTETQRSCHWCGQSPTFRYSAITSACSEECYRLLCSTAVGAGRLGIPVRTYRNRVKAGEKWCWGHRTWHPGTQEVFYGRATSVDGLDSKCKEIARERARASSRRRYVPVRERQEAAS